MNKPICASIIWMQKKMNEIWTEKEKRGSIPPVWRCFTTEQIEPDV